MTLIEQGDVWLFGVLNGTPKSLLLDELMVYLTTVKMSWHIILLVALFIIARRGKSALLLLLCVGLAVGLSDFIASGVFKPLVQRTRPCFALDHVRLLISQPRSYSFASSHAANSMAIAVVAWLFFSRGVVVEKLFTLVMFCYAVMVGISRIYVGVHYPTDVFAGMMIGTCSALLCYLIFSWLAKNVPLFIPKPSQNDG
jgi:undecaprenyl-diphosphatase